MIDTNSIDFWVLFFTIIIAIGTIIAIKEPIKDGVNKIIKWGLRDKHSLKSFDRRGDATKMMFEDMKRANELVILGISNSTLHEYFAEVMGV